MPGVGFRAGSERAHAGASHAVDRHAQLFQYFEHANVRRTARAAAAENEADTRTRRRIACRDGRAGEQHGKDGQAAEKRRGFHAEPLRELIGKGEFYCAP